MSISKRKGSPYYWYDFTVGGNRFRGSCETDDKGAAKAVESKLRTDTVLNKHLQRKPRMTLDAALGRHWNEHAQYCASAFAAMKGYGDHLIGFFGKGIYLDELDAAQVSRYKGDQIGTKSKNGTPLANATINRRLSFLRGVMNMAKREWGVEVADTNIGKFKLREPEARIRWISSQQADQLVVAAAPHLKAPIRCALLTGLRLDNILGMRWEQVNLHSRVITQKVKSSLPGRKTHETHISDALFDLLMEQKPLKNGYVFLRYFRAHHKDNKKHNDKAKNRQNPSISRPPVPIKKFRRSFKTACKKAGISDFRFHDLRHTAATWMLNNGVPLDVIQKVLGHENIETTMKYAHRSNQDKVKALDTLSVTYTSQSPKQEIAHAATTR